MEREMECGIVHCPLSIPWDPNTNRYTHPDMRRVQVLRLTWATVASAGGGAGQWRYCLEWRHREAPKSESAVISKGSTLSTLSAHERQSHPSL